MTVTNHVDGDYPTLGPTLTVLDDDGGIQKIATGPFERGRSTSTTTLRHCREGCRLEAIVFGGPDALVEAMHGTASIDALTVDGHTVPGVLDQSWHTDVSPVGARRAVVGRPAVANGRMTLQFEAHGSDSYAAVSPDDTTPAVPSSGVARPPRWAGSARAREGSSRSGPSARPSRCRSAGLRGC